MKSRYDLSAAFLNDEDVQLIWNHYGCAEFVNGGSLFDAGKSEVYAALMGESYKIPGIREKGLSK